MKIFNETKKNSILYSNYKSELNQSSKIQDSSFDSKANKNNKFNNYGNYTKNNNNKFDDNSFFNKKYKNEYNKEKNNNKNDINNISNYSNNNNNNYNKMKSFLKNGEMPGVRMYNQYINHKKKKEQKIKQIKDEEEKLESKELKFKPEINKNYGKNSEINYYPGKIEDKLIAYGNKYKEKILIKNKENTVEKEHRPKLTKETEILGKIKRKNREENLPNHIILINPDYLVEPIKRNKTNRTIVEDNLLFSFNKNNFSNKNRSKSFDKFKIKKKYYKTIYNPLHPVKRKTTKILGRKIPLPQLTPDKNLYDYLYIEAKLLKEKKDLERLTQMSKIYTFKPNLSKSMDKYKNKKLNKNKKNVFDRLYMVQNLKGRNIKTPDTKNNNNRNLFKPLITRGPLNPNQRDLSFENDINYKKLINDKKLEEIEENKKKNENKKKYIEKMNRLIFEANKLKYKELFSMLDSDNDGLISYKKIKISVLDNKKLVALTPIFQELQYNGVQMDVETFCEKADNIQELKDLTESELNYN